MSEFGKAVRDMSRAATKKADLEFEGDGLTVRDLRCGDKVIFSDAGCGSLKLFDDTHTIPEGRITATKEEWSPENHRYECYITVGFNLSPDGTMKTTTSAITSIWRELSENQAIEFIFHAERAAFDEPAWLTEGKSPGR